MGHDDKALFLAVATALLAACAHESGTTGRRAAEIMADKEAAPARHNLVRPQERPVFPVDERQRPNALTGDRDERAPVGDKPLGIEESRPGK